MVNIDSCVEDVSTIVNTNELTLVVRSNIPFTPMLRHIFRLLTPILRIINSKPTHGLAIALTDSLRYTTTLAVWMPLLAESSVAAIFGRFQALLYTSVLGVVFLVPHKVVEAGELDYERLKRAEFLFLLIGVVISIFFGSVPSYLLPAIGINANDAMKIAQMALGFVIGGTLHTLNFANQNALYAINQSKWSILANTLALITTTGGNLSIYLLQPRQYKLFFVGLSLAVGELVKTCTYKLYSCYSSRTANRRSSLSLLQEWRRYVPGIPGVITLFLDKVVEFLTLWRIGSVASDSGLAVFNLAVSINAPLFLIVIEIMQSYQATIKKLFSDDNIPGMKKMLCRLSGMAIIPSLFYIASAAMAPWLNYYGFKPNEGLVGLLSMSVLSLFNSLSFVMKQFMLCDQIVILPSLIQITSLWLAFSSSFFTETLSTFIGIMLARVSAYAIPACIFSLGCWDWINRGENSLFKRAENTLDYAKSSITNCFFRATDYFFRKKEQSEAQQLLGQGGSLQNYGSSSSVPTSQGKSSSLSCMDYFCSFFGFGKNNENNKRESSSLTASIQTS